VASPYPQRNSSRGFVSLAALALCQLLLVRTAPAQVANSQISIRMNEVKTNNCEQLQSLEVTVLNEARKPLDRQSVVKLHDLVRNQISFQTTSNESQTVFCTDNFGDFEIEVSAVGYLTEHKPVRVNRTIQTMKVEVILHKDPEAVELGAADEAIPNKARKETQRALSDLKSANFKSAQKHLDNAYKVAPSNAQINFLFGYLFLQLKDYEKAETFLKKAAEQDPRRVQPLILLGRVQLQRGEDARPTLERAVAVNPEDWMGHNLLADAYLREKKYDKAQQEAQLAIEKGKNAGTVAQLVLGQALANVGKDKEGIEALNAFLQANPNNPAAPQVKALIAEIQKRDEEGLATSSNASPSDLTLAASEPSIAESAWGPPGVDEVKPSVAAATSCPTEQVLQASGEKVKELVDNIARFAAIEDMLHEQLDKSGNPISKETRKFDYIASISETRPGFLGTSEYRNARYGTPDLPDHIVTTGFVSLALIFHPDMRDNFEMTCEGLGQWHGQATWLMYFRQRDDKPSRIADYVVGDQRYPIKLKGRAWITADSFQIAHMESDLASPLPRFPIEHQIAEYGPIHFTKRNVDLWLPEYVDIYFELNKHRYYRRHSFDHYMLFSVNAEDKARLPKLDGQAKPADANEPPAEGPVPNR
jgi:tetratricopeptide (TPR) repeat protein